jgi:hypothetical protein
LERQTAELVLDTGTGVIGKEQNARKLPLLDMAGHSPASCHAKNTPIPDISNRLKHQKTAGFGGINDQGQC